MRTHRRLFLILAVAMAVGVPLLALAAEAPHEEAKPGIINLNVTLAIQVINFLILITILSKVLYRPLTDFLAKRADGIRQSLEGAKQAREAAARAQEEYRAQIAATLREGAAMREQVQREVEEERQRLLKVSRDEAAKMVAAAKAEIEQEAKRARAQLRDEAVTLSIAVAERLLQRNLTADDQKRLAEQYVREVGGKS